MRNLISEVEDRRHFLKSCSAFAIDLASVPIALACAHHTPGKDSSSLPRTSRIDLADSQEAGTRLFISGTVFDLSGKPVPQVKMFLYHTDASGYYSRPVNNPRQARLHGTLWSDEAGRYSFASIKPAYYGDVATPPPMHIHVHLQPPNLPDHWVDSFYFDGDTRLSQQEIARGRELGRFTNVLSLKPSDGGALQGIRYFRIDPAIAERNQLADDWNRS